MHSATIDPRAIRSNPWNTNIVSHENELKIQESLRRHGFFRPVVVRETEDGEIQCLGGWHRVEQSIELGFAEVPIANMGQISDDRAKEISLLDNARYGHDDARALAELVSGLDLIDLPAVMPWTDGEVASFTASLSVNVDDLDLDEPPMTAADEDKQPEGPTTQPKTHEILRFKVALVDAANARAKIGAVMKAQGFTDSDDLTNAGDALVHILTKEADSAGTA